MTFETFNGNGDLSYEVIKYLQQSITVKTINVSSSSSYVNSNSEILMSDAIKNTNSPSLFMKSLISITRTVALYINGLNVYYNWLLETTFSSTRSQVIYID